MMAVLVSLVTVAALAPVLLRLVCVVVCVDVLNIDTKAWRGLGHRETLLVSDGSSLMQKAMYLLICIPKQ